VKVFDYKVLSHRELFVHHIAVDCQRCTSPVGSLDHNNSTFDDSNTTYILAGYTVQCEGIVTGWEFCYHTLNNVSSVTFYPGIWHGSDKTEYSLIQSNTVTFTPNGTSFSSCQNYTLPEIEQFTAPSGSVVGLYSNTGIMQPSLLLSNDTNQQITYQFSGNQSNVMVDKSVHYNIAIRVYLGELYNLYHQPFVL